LRNLRF